MRRHESQQSQESCSLSRQFRALASVFAMASLPVSGGPAKRYACANRPLRRLRRNWSAMSFCFWKSLKDMLHHLPYLLTNCVNAPAAIDHLDPMRFALGQRKVSLTHTLVEFHRFVLHPVKQLPATSALQAD